MGVKYEDNELLISHLFTKKRVFYKDLRSIRITADGIVFETCGGDKITEKDRLLDDKEKLYKAIKQHNISFRDEAELEGMTETFTREELDSMIAKTCDYAQEFTSKDVKANLGDDYDIRIKVSEIDEYIQMDFYLQIDGKDDPTRGSFDAITLAFFVEWDTISRRALYGITEELTDESKLLDALQYSMQYLYEEI